MVAIMSLPILLLVSYSLKTGREYIAHPFTPYPLNPQFFNYLGILQYSPFLVTMGRTFVLSITTATITCFTSAMVGYGFAHFRVPGNRGLFQLVIALLIVPSIILQIPQFVVYSKLGLVNTYWPWYLVAMGANPLYIFMYRQFYLGFPKELEEAAEMDGCTSFRTFLGIIIPNSKPVMATVLIFAFAAVWGDYIMPTLFLNDPTKLLGSWMVPGGPPQGDPFFYAATVLYILPVIVFFFFIQKQIQKGWIFTGISG